MPRGGSGEANRGSRAASRGGSHGRRASSASVEEDILREIRTHTEANNKKLRIKMAANVQEELRARKRQAQLDRILLPDAPPRKRRTRNPSPPRNPLDFVAQPSTSDAPVALPVEDFTIIGTDDASFNFVPETVIAGSATAPESSTVTAAPAATASTLSMPSRRPSRTSTDANSDNFEDTVCDWLDNVQQESEDEDLLDDDDGDNIQVNMGIARTVDDYANNDALPSKEATLLKAQEEAEDLYLRNLAPTSDFFEFNWTSDRHTFVGQREVFTGTPGPTFPVTDDTTPTDVFYKMFDIDFIDCIVQQTNLYGEQTLDKLRRDPRTKKHTRCSRWTPTNRDEMYAFLALIILQGLYPKVNEESYFSYDGFGTTPYFKYVMSYNRYYLLKTCLHFIDNDASLDRTKLNKIRPVIDHFNARFSTLYSLEQNIAVDESLLKWHGRLTFSQKIKTKAAQVGVKTYELCESSSGYLWQFRVYTGKDGPDRTTQGLPDHDHTVDRPDHDHTVDRHDHDHTVDRHDHDHTVDRHDHDHTVDRPDHDHTVDRPDHDHTVDRPDHDHTADRPDDNPTRPNGQSASTYRPRNATSQIVYDLVEPLLHRGHTLIMDNFYNSPLLARCLKHDKMDVYGTLRPFREFVPETLRTLKKTDLRQGEVVASYCSDLSVMAWRDSNLITMISTFHPLQIGTVSTNNRTQVFKPAIVLDYNKSMGGVDRKDQFLAGQPLERQKSKVWYKKLFRRLYNAAVFNCFVIYTSNATHKIEHRQFRKRLAEDLLRVHKRIDLTIEPRLLRPQQPQPMTQPQPTMQLASRQTTRTYVASNHFPIKTGSTHTRCWLCTKSKRPTRTSYKCEECNVNLCLNICFKEYHKPPRT